MQSTLVRQVLSQIGSTAKSPDDPLLLETGNGIPTLCCDMRDGPREVTLLPFVCCS